jgi:hypothetical protein
LRELATLTAGGHKKDQEGKFDMEGTLTLTLTKVDLKRIRLPICTGTRKHFIDTKNVEWVSANADMVRILPCELGQVLVAGNASSFKCFGGQLFLFIGHHVSNKGERVYRSFLSTNIVNTDFWVWNTTAEARLDEGLLVLETITLGWLKDIQRGEGGLSGMKSLHQKKKERNKSLLKQSVRILFTYLEERSGTKFKGGGEIGKGKKGHSEERRMDKKT